MNIYAKEGKKFLKTLADYFMEFEKIVGHSIKQHLRNCSSNPTKAPDNIKIIDSLDIFSHYGGEKLTLCFMRRENLTGNISNLTQ